MNKPTIRTIIASPSLVLTFAIIFIALICAFSQGQGDVNLTDRFLREAPARWKEFRDRSKQVQGQGTIHLSGSLNNVQAHNVFDYKSNDTCQLIILGSKRTTTYQGGKSNYDIHEVCGINPLYAFRLKRKSAESPWIVTELVRAQDEGIPADFGNNQFSHFLGTVNILVQLEREFLSEVIKKPTFRVLSSRSVQHDNEDLVEITFDNSHTPEVTGYDVQSGKMVLDPNRFWCLRSYDVQTDARSVRGSARFQVQKLVELDHSLPVPTRAEYEGHFVFSNGDKNDQVFRYELKPDIPKNLPDESEFTLSAFGIPEPPGLEKPSLIRRIPIYYWVAGIGIVIFILGIVARRMMAKRTEAPASSP